MLLCLMLILEWLGECTNIKVIRCWQAISMKSLQSGVQFCAMTIKAFIHNSVSYNCPVYSHSRAGKHIDPTFCSVNQEATIRGFQAPFHPAALPPWHSCWRCWCCWCSVKSRGPTCPARENQEERGHLLQGDKHKVRDSTSQHWKQSSGTHILKIRNEAKKGSSRKIVYSSTNLKVNDLILTAAKIS